MNGIGFGRENTILSDVRLDPLLVAQAQLPEVLAQKSEMVMPLPSVYVVMSMSLFGCES